MGKNSGPDPTREISSMALGECQSNTTPSSSKPRLRPSDILNLKKESQDHVSSPLLRDTEPNQNQMKSIPQFHDTAARNYVIPQKRVMELRLHRKAPDTSSEPPRSRWDNGAKNGPRKLKEKVLGGLSKEAVLQAVWAEFDEDERRKKFNPKVELADVGVSGNEVLGAWEDEAMLYDLSCEEGD